MKLCPPGKKKSGDTITALVAMTSAEETVRSRANPLFKRLRALKERGPRDGVCLLEGPKLLREALAAGLSIVEVALTPEAEGRPELAD